MSKVESLLSNIEEELDNLKHNQPGEDTSQSFLRIEDYIKQIRFVLSAKTIGQTPIKTEE